MAISKQIVISTRVTRQLQVKPDSAVIRSELMGFGGKYTIGKIFCKLEVEEINWSLVHTSQLTDTVKSLNL